MRTGRIFFLIGRIIVVLGLAMILPLACSLIYKDGDTAAFGISIIICLVCGLLLVLANRRHRRQTMRRRDSFLFATLVWLSAAFFGALPFLFYGSFPDFASCFFESMSGFTTTGASALALVESQPHGILLWRSLSHWLGGAGIVLIFVTLIQRGDDRGEGVVIFKAEYSGGNLTQRVSPRIEDNALDIFCVYTGITLLCMLFLLGGGMSFFDAVNHSMSIAATGGFSTKTLSIAAFNSAYLEWVTAVFMIISGINYGLIYMMVVRRRIGSFFKNQELRMYLAVIAVSSVLIALSLHHSGYYVQEGFAYSLRQGLFHTASIVTTTGLVATDFDLWPHFARFILVALMLAGGCSGSTAGSIKISRWLVALKSLCAEFTKVYRPNAVRRVYYNNKLVSGDVSRRMITFFFLYICLAIMGGLLLTLAGMDWLEGLTSAMTALGNVGPATGSVGPAGSFAEVSAAAKWVLSFLMLVGRLELYTVLVLFAPGIWKK